MMFSSGFDSHGPRIVNVSSLFVSLFNKTTFVPKETIAVVLVDGSNTVARASSSLSLSRESER